jgi:hypothetical protein
MARVLERSESTCEALAILSARSYSGFSTKQAASLIKVFLKLKEYI